MPPYRVHEAVAEDVFGIPIKVAERVNRIIDERIVHDLGRRMPPKPKLSTRFLKPEKAIEQLVTRERAALILDRLILRGWEWAYAFWLHHALDLLAPRLVAVKITGVDLKRFKENLRRGICKELELLLHDPSAYKLHLDKFISTFKLKFDEIIFHPCLNRWAEREAEKRRGLRIDIQEFLRSLIQCSRKRRREKEMETEVARGKKHAWIHATIHKELHEAIRLKREYGRLISKLSQYAAQRSNLFSYALLLPFPRERISGELARLTQNILRICEIYESDDERWREIIKAVRDFEESLLTKHNITLPQECIERYAGLFIEGYETVASMF